MKNRRSFLSLIIALSILAFIVDLPKNFKVNFKIGKFSIDRVFSGPDLDIKIGPLTMKKELNLKEGLDLQGGTQLTLQADMKDISQADRDKALESSRLVIDRRVNFFGVSEPVIQTAKTNGDYRIIVELPGVKDVNQAIDLIGKTAELRFYETEASKSANASESAGLQFSKDTGLSGKDLKKSDVQFDPNTGKPEVAISFSADGAKLFEEITQRNVGKPVAIVLDNQIISAPRVNQVISGGNAVITGEFTLQEAKNLSIELNAGSLPVPVKIVEQRNIGATLGTDSVQKSVMAGFIGLTTVMIFMFLYYGLKGLLADIALIIYALISLALFKLVPVTMTLSGIAGFILSIGMAVDANILIFERMKEEERWGKPKHIAMELGFARAWTSIRDSNASSLITCGILYWFGTGSVRGFALTLALGIAVSLFSAIVVTRTFLRSVYKL